MSNYSDWAASVDRFLAGLGFLFPASHYQGFGEYMKQAHEMGMTAQRCAANLQKRHEMAGTGRGGPMTESCGMCAPCRQADPIGCWAPKAVRP